MKTLIIYDQDGYIFTQVAGDYRVPNGIPHLEVDIPEGKFLSAVDTSITPNVPIFTEGQKSETDAIKERLEATEQMLLQIMMEGAM